MAGALLESAEADEADEANEANEADSLCELRHRHQLTDYPTDQDKPQDSLTKPNNSRKEMAVSKLKIEPNISSRIASLQETGDRFTAGKRGYQNAASEITTKPLEEEYRN